LKEHITKENNILFPAAVKQLSESMQGEIEEKFEELERNVIGVGKHEEYHGWLKELQQRYLQ
jgi:hemerythrin-like domain-containing protein